MQLLRKLIAFLLFLTAHGLCSAQGTPSSSGLALKIRIMELGERYNRHQLADTVYLKAMDSIAPLLVKADSLVQLLTTYRQIAFNDPRLGVYRGKYYTCLALNAYNKSNYGGAIYYSERNNEEKVKAGIFEKGGIPHSDMFAITVYYNNRDYARVLARYDSLRPLLLNLAENGQNGSLTPEKAFVAFGILNAADFAAYKSGDTLRGEDGFRICSRMIEGVRRFPDKYKAQLPIYEYVFNSTAYVRERHRKHFEQADQYLDAAMTDALSRDFPSTLQPSYVEELYTEAFDFFYDQHRMDSAEYYLNKVRKMNDTLVKYSTLEPTFLPEGMSKLLASKGQFEEAYRTLRRVEDIRDSAYYSVTTDRNNNMYALAQAEDTRNELIRTEARTRLAEKYNLLLIALLAILLLAGASAFFRYRTIQEKRLLNLQLSLARNFHDEVGPMLLYANTLAKVESESNPSPRMEELKGQISNIMQAVRSISHDLRATGPSTVEAFGQDIRGLLEKIKAATEIRYSLNVQTGNKVLSHMQYTNLKKIINELIANSIKHSSCDEISVQVRAGEKELLIRYADNGPGMASDTGAVPGIGGASSVGGASAVGAGSGDGASIGGSSDKEAGPGIGLVNMKERVALLNGEVELHNFYPKGYYIELSIPLL